MRNPQLAVAVIRSSTGTQTNTPDVQAAAIAAWASDNGVTVIQTVMEIDVSGMTPFPERAGLLQALELLDQHQAGILLFADRSRIARDTLVVAMMTRHCQTRNILLRTADGTSGDLAPTDPATDLVVNILDAVSQFERTLIAKRTRAALAAKKARGERTGGIPYGKQMHPNNTTMVPNEAEQIVIETTRALHKGGMSLRKIAAHLTTLGLHPRTGKTWGKTQIVRMLQA